MTQQRDNETRAVKGFQFCWTSLSQRRQGSTREQVDWIQKASLSYQPIETGDDRHSDTADSTAKKSGSVRMNSNGNVDAMTFLTGLEVRNSSSVGTKCRAGGV